MADQESTVFRELNNIIKSAREISEVEPSLGDLVSFFVSQAMGLYESTVRQEELNLRDIIQFVGRFTGRREKDLLSIAYPETIKVGSTDDDPISSIVHADDVDLENYKKTAETLIKKFREEVQESVGTSDG